MPRKQKPNKLLLNTEPTKPKYRQLDISVFLVPESKVNEKKFCKKKIYTEFSNITKVKKNKMLGNDSNNASLPFELPEYEPPTNLIVLSSDEEESVTPPKQRKLVNQSQGSSDTGVLAGEDNEISDKSPASNFSRLSLNSSKVDVLPSQKNVSLMQEKTQQQFLKVKSNDVLVNRPERDKIGNNSNSGNLLARLASSSSSCLNEETGELQLLRPVRHLPRNTIQDVQGTEINYSYLQNFNDIYDFVLSHPQLSQLLNEEEKLQLNIFWNELDERYIYFSIRLYLRNQKWINIIKLKNFIKLPMTDGEVKQMYDCLLGNYFIDSDVSSDTPIDLLNHLNVCDIKDICKSFKFPEVKAKKEILIKKLLHYCNHQPSVLSFKNIAATLMDRIKQKMGICVKLNSRFYNTLHKLHLLFAFPVREFRNASELYYYLVRIQNGTIILPKYSIDKSIVIFPTIEEFECYAQAHECREKIELAFEKKNKDLMMELCDFAYMQLKKLDQLEEKKIASLCIFTPDYVYTKTLSFGVQHLTKHAPERVTEFLKFLLSRKGFCQNMRGAWYDLLVMIQYNYLKEYVVAAETIIKALSDTNLSEIDTCILNNRAENIKKNKSNRLSKLVSDRICFAQINRKLPFIEIDAQAVSGFGNSGKKRYVEYVDGTPLMQTVEEVSLRHYTRVGYPKGVHCESSLIWSLFCTLLWNIIYDDTIPKVFISSIQHLPLDFYTKDFYTTRKHAIDNLLNDIQNDTVEQLAENIYISWIKNSVMRSLINTNLSLDYKDIYDIINCIKKQRLILIFRKMLSDMKIFRAGLPDLFVWNPETKKCKFVEVKSDKDKLSCRQEIWLRFLRSIGCDAEICNVHSTGSKSRAAYRKKQ